MLTSSLVYDGNITTSFMTCVETFYSNEEIQDTIVNF
ncbi:hypothetical protein LINGRAHAP2_LOCUS10532 [Linum grandiflorum]